MIKIVVVEDEKLLRQGLVMTTPWEELGCVIVGEAANAFDGLELVRRLEPDLVITDIRMPDKSGLEMIEQAKKLVDCEYIIISGHSEFQYAKQALALGVRGYLLKPIDDDEFETVLRKTIENITKRQEQEALLRHLDVGDKKLFADILSPPSSGKIRYLDAALTMIRDNCGEDIVLKDIADRLFISERYLGKLFKEHTSYTFLEYLTLCRIARAAEMLNKSDRKVYEIASAVGYSDTRYFSAIFKKVMGTTPTEYKSGLAQAPRVGAMAGGPDGDSL